MTPQASGCAPMRLGRLSAMGWRPCGLVLAGLALSPAASAHGAWFSGGAAQAPVWFAQALFVLAWLAYLRGALRQPPATWRRATVFHATMGLAGLTLFGPFDGWAARSSAAHMLQHLLLMGVVAPLAVLARPLPQWRAALGPVADTLWRGCARLSRRPMACALLHALAIWTWHAPGPYLAALSNPGLHVLEHASFLFTGWLFWWSVLRPGRDAVLQAALALLFTVTHTGMLGALLTFARQPLYAPESRDLWDQQLAGLLMWIPGGTLYLLAASWAGYRWLSRPVPAPPVALPAQRQ